MELAALGGKPAFIAPLYVGSPIVESETRALFHKLIDQAFDRNYLTNDGPFARKLEEEIAQRHRVKHALLVCNATLAQQILLRAMGLHDGEALVSANTFIATAHACEWQGVKPVFCDLEWDSLGLDPDDAAGRITEKTRAIIPTHLFGNMVDMPRLVELARKRGLKMLVDAAHAFDCDLNGTPPGGFGVPEFFSFHATKYFSTMEGGAIVTDDDALASELKSLRNFGFAGVDRVTGMGTNTKISEVSAAFGVASLPVLEKRREMLRESYDAYREQFSKLPGWRMQELGKRGRNNYRYSVFFVDAGKFGLERDVVYQALRRENVIARRYFYPGCHRMPYYLEQRGRVCLPRTDQCVDSVICLPNGMADPRGVVSKLFETVSSMHENAGRLRDWFRGLPPE